MLAVKSIFITGASGFLGANLVHFFAKDKKTNLYLLVRHNSKNLWRIKTLLKQKNVHLVYGDITDKNSLQFLTQLRPEVIIHNAIYGGYGFQQPETEKVIQTNFMGTVNLLEIVKKLDFRCLLVSGSSSEYGIKNAPMSETDRLEPIGAYGVAKAAATLYAQAVAQQTGKKIFCIRPFSLYGPYEEKNRFIPYLVMSYIRKQKKLFLRTPQATRDFLFIDDAVDLYHTVIQHSSQLTPGEIFNLGSGKETRVIDLIALFNKIFNYTFEIELEKGIPREGDVFCTWQASMKKAKKILHWQPHNSLPAGFKKTVTWFKKNLSYYQN